MKQLKKSLFVKTFSDKLNVMGDAVQRLMSPEKGVLALDWSSKTIAKQFTKVGLVSTPELNRIYRQMLLTTPGIAKYISGVILHDETVNQKLDSGVGFVEFLNGLNIVAGVRADEGSEKYKDTDQDITLGLESLDEKLKNYKDKGVGLAFSKWRSAFKITDVYPSDDFLEESVTRLTEFAKISQKYGFVPFVEPDVEIAGTHTTTRCAEITTEIIKLLFERLNNERVDLNSLILKTSMVTPGVDSGVVAAPLEVANATLLAFRKAVPVTIGGIVLLSGGQSYDDAVEYLDKIEDLSKDDPWKISFSYARALQKDALEKWGGEEENSNEAQKVLIERLKKVSLARRGEL